MTRNIDLASRLREVFLSGQWIGNTNYKTQLLNTTWQQGTQKIGEHNSIAALTFHVNYYLTGLLHVFNGGQLEIKDKYSFDLPAITSEQDWKNMVSDFLNNAEQFANAVEQFSHPKLDESFVEEKYGSYLRNIEGVIEHSYYHLGQVSLLKKLL
jgi:hypothetical protein